MSEGPYISLNEAAKITGKAKSTISKALKSGKMSYVSKDAKTGTYEIDPAEADRVFPKNRKLPNSYQSENASNPTESNVLEVKLHSLEQRFSDAEKTIEDLRNRLDKSETARERQDVLLADMRKTKPDTSRRSLWARLKG